MNATELYLKDGRSSGVFFCEQCRRVSAEQTIAEQCCKPYKCQDCGKETKPYHMVCDACSNAREVERERVRFEKAEKLTTWDGWVYDGNKYYSGLYEMFDEIADDEGAVPNYVWTCKPTRFVHAEVSDITERIGDSGDAYDDWDPDTLTGLDELRAALDKFNEANTDAISYSPDYSKAVIITKEAAVI